MNTSQNRHWISGRRLLLLTSGAILAGAVSGTAVAQSAANSQLQEIIVTASKRNEKVLDLPLSITAVTNEVIAKRGLTASEEYLRGIPGVAQTGQTEGQHIIIRGLDTTTDPFINSTSAGSTTAIYFGETPTTTSAGLAGTSSNDLKLVDIDRIEVLRGPQGTAFGSAALGGAVRIIPAAPNLGEVQGRVATEVSNTARYGGTNFSANGMVNVPLIKDKLALRAVAYHMFNTGYTRNVAGSNAAYRAALVTPYGAQADAVDVSRSGDSEANGVRISALAAPTDRLRISLGYTQQDTKQKGYLFTNLGTGYEYGAQQMPSPWFIDGLAIPQNKTRTKIYNAQADYNADWANMTVVYSRLDSGSSSDTPGLVNFSAPFRSISPHKEDVIEARVSTHFKGPFNLLAGVYHGNSRDVIDFAFVYSGNPAFSIFPLLDPSKNLIASRTDIRALRQDAVFGEASLEVLPRLTATAGARYYRYDRETHARGTGVAFFGPNGIKDDLRQKVPGHTYKANISYKPNSDTNIYAGWAQGFRLGAPQTILPATCDNNADGLVDGTSFPISATGNLSSDSVNNYEVGGKFALLNRHLRVDIAAFRIDWKDIPIQVDPAISCALRFTVNAGRARSEGGEIQLTFRATDNIRIDMSGSYTNARLTTAVPSIGAPKGARLPGSPKLNGTLGLEYSGEIADRNFFVRADATYVGDFYANPVPTPTTRAGNYVLIDLNSGITFDKVHLGLFAKNLFNEDKYTLAVGNTFANANFRMRPRTIGARLSYEY